MSHYSSQGSSLRRRGGSVRNGDPVLIPEDGPKIDQSILTVYDKELLNTSRLSKPSYQSIACESCGRQDDKEEPASRGVLMQCVRRVDLFIHNWWEQGLWVLAMGLTGVVAVFILCFGLFHTIHFLKENLVVTNAEGEEKPFKTYMAQCLCFFLGTVLFYLLWRKVRDAHTFQRYLNKGVFGTSQQIPSNGIIQVSLEEYHAQMVHATEQEKSKLFASEEYQDALARKGNNASAWNWQTREKELTKRRSLNNTQVFGNTGMGRSNTQLRDQPSIGHDSSVKLSGHEMLDQDFSDDNDAQSDHRGRAPPIEVQLMEIDNQERKRRDRNQQDVPNAQGDLSMSVGARRRDKSYLLKRLEQF